jgi:carbonic anhydrase
MAALNFLTITNFVESVIEDVERIRRAAVVSTDITIYGCIYDVKSGKLIEVPEATEAKKIITKPI